MPMLKTTLTQTRNLFLLQTDEPDVVSSIPATVGAAFVLLYVFDPVFTLLQDLSALFSHVTDW